MSDFGDIVVDSHHDRVHVAIEDIDHAEIGESREAVLVLTAAEAIEFAEDLLSAARRALVRS